MKGKIYTLDEVNKMLPLLRPIVTDIVAKYHDVNTALTFLEDARVRKDEAKIAAENERVGRELEAFQRLIKEVENLGGAVKDYEQGMVDFYGDVDGQIVYFCWYLSEPSITHYHGVEQGFSDRREVSAVKVA